MRNTKMTEATVNNSGLIPVGRAVLVRPYTSAIESSVIEIPDSVQDRHALLDQRAIVIAVGAHCWPDEPARCKVGDRVLLARLAGTFAKGTLDNKSYRFVNDRDIFAVISKEADHV